MSEDACRVCGNERGNSLHRAREMFAGTRDEFDYVECASCGTLQIREVPDLRPYYSGDYYSLRPPEQATSGAGLKRRLAHRAGSFIRGRVAGYYCGRRRPFGEWLRPLGRLLAARAGRVAVGFPDDLKDTRLALRLRPGSGLRDVHRLLKPGHYAVVRIPVVARAWREYGDNRVQLDAPRHLFLYPAQTFKSLAEEAGFAVDEVAERCSVE
jgi:hypothetical protein